MRNLLILLLVAFLLTACGSESEPEKEETISEETISEETEQDVEKKAPIDVNINVEAVQEGGSVYFLGETNLPDYAELMFTVSGDSYSAQTSEMVSDGKFKTELFSKEGESLPAGEYSLSVSLSIPPTQDEKFVNVAGESYEYLGGDLMDEDVLGKSMDYETTFTIESVQDITDEEVKEIIEYAGLSEDDKLISAELNGDEIKAIIKIGEGVFEPTFMAVSTYSQSSDALFEMEGWEKLTIEFVDIGTITMNKKDKETNEVGMDYFPVAKIEENLKH